MKKLILSLLLLGTTLLIPNTMAQSNHVVWNGLHQFFTQEMVVPEQSYSSTGLPILRIHNYSRAYLSCQVRDRYNFQTFAILPFQSSMWYVVRGEYWWNCDAINPNYGPIPNPHRR